MISTPSVRTPAGQNEGRRAEDPQDITDAAQNIPQGRLIPGGPKSSQFAFDLAKFLGGLLLMLLKYA
jgi:hypothetical protein